MLDVMRNSVKGCIPCFGFDVFQAQKFGVTKYLVNCSQWEIICQYKRAKYRATGHFECIFLSPDYTLYKNIYTQLFYSFANVVKNLIN